MQGLLAANGVVGPREVIGNPLQFGSEMVFEFQEGGAAVEVRIVTGTLYGSQIVAATNGRGVQLWCAVPFAGLVATEYGGVRALVLRDVVAYLSRAYSDYADDGKAERTIAKCGYHRYSSYRLDDLPPVTGSLRQFLGACDIHGPVCHSVQAVSMVLEEMIAWFAGVGNESGLAYAAACDTGRFIHRSGSDSDVLLSRAAIAITSTDMSKWQRLLISAASTNTTFIVYNAVDDRSLRVCLSRFSGICIYLLPVAQLGLVALSDNHFTLPVSMAIDRDEAAALAALCSSADFGADEVDRSGVLQSARLGLCLLLNASGPVFVACDVSVWAACISNHISARHFRWRRRNSP